MYKYKFKMYKNCGLLLIEQTDGPSLCFEDQYEALQVSRNNCRLPGKLSKNQVVPKCGHVPKMLGRSLR